MGVGAKLVNGVVVLVCVLVMGLAFYRVEHPFKLQSAATAISEQSQKTVQVVSSE